MKLIWPIKKLGEVCEFIYGYSFPADLFNQEWRGLPVIKTGDIKNNSCEYFYNGDYDKKYLIKPNDILIGLSGTIISGQWRGKSALLNQRVVKLNNFSSDIDKSFAFYVLPIALKNLERSLWKAAVKNILKQHLESLEILLPPLSTQQKIVKVLDSVQEAVGMQEKLIERTKELKKSLVNEIFNAKVKNQKSKLQFKIQKWVKLSEVAKIERGKFAHRPRNDPAFYGGDISFVQTGDVTLSNGHVKQYSQTLNEKGLSVSRVFPKGTIVITIAANIGYSAILDFDSAFPDSLIGITPNKEIDSEFLNYYLSSQQKRMDEIASRGTQKNINIEFLKPWPIPLLTLNHQREIADILQTIDQKIEIEEKKRGLYEELFRAMLNGLMNRKIDVEGAKFD